MEGRKAWLMELDSCYADVIVRRWQEHTGQTVVLEEAHIRAGFGVTPLGSCLTTRAGTAFRRLAEIRTVEVIRK